MNARLTLSTLLLALVLVSGCKSSETASRQDQTASQTEQENDAALQEMVEQQRRDQERSGPGVDIDPNRPLIDHLRQFPSLIILARSSGYDVRMRGNRSISQPDRVLFVINNTPVGQSYDQASSLITMYNVERIDVLSAGFAQQRYGERGMFGAVVITTRD